MVTTEKRRLVVLDVEGVLLPKNRFIFEVGKKSGFFTLVKLLFWGFLYEIGLLKLASALRRIFKELEGIDLETLYTIFGNVPASPLIQGVFCQLKSRNCKIALISSGIPTVI